jgi:hypothetical protein
VYFEDKKYHEMMVKLLELIREISKDCKSVRTILRLSAINFKEKKAGFESFWSIDDRQKQIKEMAERFAELKKEAKEVYEEITKEYQPDKKSKALIGSIVSLMEGKSYHSYSDYISHIKVALQLKTMCKLSSIMTTIAAFGCFIKGLDHIEEILNATLTAYSVGYCHEVFFAIHRDITWVIIAMATSLYFESVTLSIKELRIGIDITEIRWHSLARVFMDKVYEEITKDSNHATSTKPPVAIGCTFDAPDKDEPLPDQISGFLKEINEDKSIISESDDETKLLMMERIEL